MASGLISKDQQDLIALLEQDVQQAFQNVANNDQFWCRTLVRAVFAYFEAYGFVIRSVTMGLLKPTPGDFDSIAKLVLLADTGYQPGRTGKLEDAGEPKTAFINYLAFTLRTYAEVSGLAAADIDNFFGENAFNQLQRAKKVRDRLTHPKKLVDAEVTPADVVDVTNAYNWLARFASEIELRLVQAKQGGGTHGNP